MRLSNSVFLLAIFSQSLTAFSAPIDIAEPSDDLVSREAEGEELLEARNVLLDFDAREWEDLDDLSTRELEELELAIRSLSDDELLELEARGKLGGLVKLAKAAASPVKKLVSKIKPGKSSSPAKAIKKSTPKAPSSKPKSTSSKKPTAAAKKPSGKSSSSGKKSSVAKSSSKSSSKKSGAKPTKAKASSSKAAVSGKSSKSSSSKKKASSSGSSKSGKSGSSKSKKSTAGAKGKASTKGGSKKGDGKKKTSKGKKSGKKDDKTTKTRNRSFNLNVDPGSLLNAGAAVANVIMGATGN